ncbi:hypothetical protein MUP00_02570, partial [Candidatus Bathyarchaeota archaeon]|nr:hypothetical protein [Candidatus Bathyarchaeota archaeon]
MNPFTAGARVLGQEIDKRGQIVVGDFLALSPGSRVDRLGLPHRRGHLRGGDAEFAPCFNDESFDFLPRRQ